MSPLVLKAVHGTAARVVVAGGEVNGGCRKAIQGGQRKQRLRRWQVARSASTTRLLAITFVFTSLVVGVSEVRNGSAERRLSKQTFRCIIECHSTKLKVVLTRNHFSKIGLARIIDKERKEREKCT